jgi:hypothetical protein
MTAAGFLSGTGGIGGRIPDFLGMPSKMRLAKPPYKYNAAF